MSGTDCVLSTDEKTSIQARQIPSTQPQENAALTQPQENAALTMWDGVICTAPITHLLTIGSQNTMPPPNHPRSPTA